MASQTSYVNTAPGPIHSVANRLTRFAATAMDLFNLQTQLIVEDSKDAQRHIKAAGIAALLATVLLITSLPMFGFGLVEWLVTQWRWDRSVASLVLGGTLAVVALILLATAWRLATNASKSFENSRREAIENLAWLRNAIERQSSTDS
jgi:Zn-dependent protease